MNTTTTGRELEYCSACRYDPARHRRYAGYSHEYESKLPIIYRDELTGIWFVHCQNCNMRVFWSGHRRDQTLKRYNKMSRVPTYNTPMGPVPWDRLPRPDGTYMAIGHAGHEGNDRVSRLIVSMPRDGNARRLPDTAVKDEDVRRSRRSAIVGRFYRMGWRKFTARWGAKGLYWSWSQRKLEPGEPKKMVIGSATLQASGDGMTHAAADINDIEADLNQ